MWKSDKMDWDLIGEVTGQGGQGQNSLPKKAYYPGDNLFPAGDYDYIFEIAGDNPSI